jgi:WD40 repeat protein
MLHRRIVARAGIAFALLLSLAPVRGQEPAAGKDAAGDPLPPGAIARLGTLRFRHQDECFELAYTPDGAHLWSIDMSGALRCWDPATGVLQRELQVGPVPVCGFSLSPDGRRFAISRNGPGVGPTVVDATTGAQLLDYSDHGTSAVFSADGRWLAVWGHPFTKVELRNADGTPHLDLNEQVTDIRDAAISRDGSLVAILGLRKLNVRQRIGLLSVRDAVTGDTVFSHETQDVAGTSVAFSPDGKRIAVGDEIGQVHIFDARSGEEKASAEGITVPVRDVGWSPDGRYLVDAAPAKTAPAPGVPDGFALRDGSSLELVREILGHGAAVSSIAFSPDGKCMATACRDHDIRLWDVETGARLLAPPGHDSTVTALAMSADGSRLVSGGGDGTVGAWDPKTWSLQKLQHCTPMSVIALACTADGRFSAASSFDGTLALRDVATGQNRGSFAGDGTTAVRALAFLPDGRTLVTGDQDGKARLRDVSALLSDVGADPGGVRLPPPVTRELDAGGATVFAVAASPDGHLIATGTSRLRVFAAADGKLIADVKCPSPLLSIAFSPDSSLIATANADRSVRLFDAASGAERGTLSGHTARVEAVAFSSDGRLVASAGENENQVRLWDVIRLSPAGQLAGHLDVVNALAAPGPGLMASASVDGTILVWKLPEAPSAQPGG